MERFQSWIALSVLSLVMVGSLYDEVPEGGRSGKSDFALVVSYTSFILGSLFSIANIVDPLRNMLIGNVIENAVASIIMALWVVSIAFIQNPGNGIATDVVGGIERILYANLYFFSWLTFLVSVYTVGVTFRDNFQFGPKFGLWMLLFTASIVLLSSSVSAKPDICQYYAEDLQCSRTNYAIGVGAVGVSIAALAVILSICDALSKLIETASTGLATILYFFGVIFLTSGSGPAKAMGNMYFSLWGGCFVSFVLFIGAVFPNSGEGGDQQGGNNNVGHNQEDHI